MSQTLRYKGYDGSVLYSAEDRLLHGTIVGIRAMVSYEGTDVDSLEENFRKAIEEYLAFCHEEGQTPDTGSFQGERNTGVSPLRRGR